MARQHINIGTTANDGAGDTIRDSFDKVNDNFIELYANVTTSGSTSSAQDIKGSVFADDSTLLVDGANGTIPAANLSGALPAIDGSALTGVTVSSIAFADVTATPTTIAGYGITDAYTKTEVDNAITSSVLPSGSTQSIDIVAADSTTLVDSVNGTLNATTLTGALPAIDGSSLTGITTAFSNITSTPTTLAGYGITDAATLAAPAFTGAVDFTGTTSVDFTGATVTGLNVTGDITGSVFADDSTVLVDGVNGTLNSSALTMPISIPDGSISSNYIGFGDDDDLKIFHNGSSSIITETNLASSLILRSYQDVRLADAGGTETMLKAISHGAVELYHNNVKKIETTADGVKLGDDGKATFGDSDDLQIYHTGGVSYIAGAGSTILTGNWLYLRKPGTTENYLICKAEGAVELYYDNVKKLETTTDGVAVTGKITGLTDPTAAQDAATKAYVDSSITDVTAGYFDFNITGDDSTVRTVSSGSTIGIVGGTGITTASDADGNITITASGGGGSGLQSRSTATATTGSIPDGSQVDLDITGFKSYALLSITTDRAARVRLYVSGATRSADVSRAEGVDPTSDAGLIAEVITTGAETVIISPGAFGFNLEGVPTSIIPCRVTNKSGSSSTVQVDLNILQLEA